MFVFFFQAEDGIRDWSVTGVQTCALPIYENLLARHRLSDAHPAGWQRTTGAGPKDSHRFRLRRDRAEHRADRSEERRVGKESRTKGGRCDDQTKKKRHSWHNGITTRRETG